MNDGKTPAQLIDERIEELGALKALVRAAVDLNTA
jgi:hypothetical protein